MNTKGDTTFGALLKSFSVEQYFMWWCD